MSRLLSAKYSNFVLEFSEGWVKSEIEKKYQAFFDRNDVPFDNILDYLSHTIQSVSWPGKQVEIVQQKIQHEIKPFKPGTDSKFYNVRQIDVSFSVLDGYLNYFILQDIFELYHELGCKAKGNSYMPDIFLHILDSDGYITTTLQFKDIVFSAITSLDLSYSSNTPDFKGFNITLNYRQYETIRNLE